jgi:excisionase family DNA binding protein
MARIMLAKKKAEAPADLLAAQGSAGPTTHHPAINALIRLLMREAAQGHGGQEGVDRRDSIDKAEKAIAGKLTDLLREYVAEEGGKEGGNHVGGIMLAEDAQSVEDAADLAGISTRNLRRFSQHRRARAPTAPSELLSVQEAAGYAKVSTQTVRRWIKARNLKIYRAGRQLRIDKSDLVDFLSFNFDE